MGFVRIKLAPVAQLVGFRPHCKECSLQSGLKPRDWRLGVGQPSRGGLRAQASRSSYAASLPSSEAELLSQIQTSVQQALSDGLSMIEVQFPVDTVSRGDCIAISELNANMQAMRRFCEVFEWLGQAERVRVFFPDAGEMNIAVNGAGKNPTTGQWDMAPVWSNWPGPLDYLLNDDILSKTAIQMYDQQSVYQIKGKEKVEEQVEMDDLLYVIGYPYEDYEEMLSVMELCRVQGRRTIVFNGSLDNVRNAFFPFGKMKKLKDVFIPQFQAAFYIHTFKGQNPGALYRTYPGPWKVLLAMAAGGFKCVKEYEERPQLKEVAQEFFYGGLKQVGLSTRLADAAPAEEQVVDYGKYYKLLGVPESVDHKELQQAYRKVAMEHHPDRGGDTQKFYEINRAYAMLKEMVEKEEYRTS